MFLRCSLGALLTAAVLLAAPALAQLDNPPPWWGQTNDPMTESRDYGFGNNNWPPQADNPDDQHGGVEPDWSRNGDVTVADGKIKIAGAGSWVEIRFHNLRVQENKKTIWLQYEYMFTAAISGPILKVPPNTKVTKQSDRDDKNVDGFWHRRTITWTLDPQPEWESIRFTVYQGALWIRNLKFGSHCEEKWECDGGSDGYFYDVPAWPPESGYIHLPDGYEYTQWNRDGTYPPEWMHAVTDHEGVIGMPGGGEEPLNGVLAARLDTGPETEGTRQVSCQFDYYMAEGSVVEWAQAVPPDTTIENHREGFEELFDGWMRVTVTFDATPPPDWVEFHWLMFTDPVSGPAAIDNVIMSSAAEESDSRRPGGGDVFGPIAPTSIRRLVPGMRWSENFDKYEPGSGLHGQAGWKGWDNDPAFDAFVTDVQAHSAPQSVDVAEGSDLVHEFDGCTSGRWVFTAWQYIPEDFTSDNGSPFDPGTYFLLLNTYSDGGPYDWSIQYNFDSNDGMLKVCYGNGRNTIDVPYVTDRWVKIEAIIDLDEDWTQIYYDDIVFTPYSWTGGIYGEGGGALDIAAVDLFANGSSSVYYDDLSLRPAMGP